MKNKYRYIRVRVLRGEEQRAAKLTDKKVIEIFELWNEGYTQKWIASKFKVPQNRVSQVLYRKAWCHVKVDKALIPKFYLPKGGLKRRLARN